VHPLSTCDSAIDRTAQSGEPTPQTPIISDVTTFTILKTKIDIKFRRALQNGLSSKTQLLLPRLSCQNRNTALRDMITSQYHTLSSTTGKKTHVGSMATAYPNYHEWYANEKTRWRA
jgi:hypothetical protein